MMNVSTAADAIQEDHVREFLEKHNMLKNMLSNANERVTELEKELTSTNLLMQLTKDESERQRERADRYLRYSVELGSQLQFIISGSVRALQIAGEVLKAVDQETQTKVPKIPGVDAETITNLDADMAGMVKGINGIEDNEDAPHANVTTATKMMQTGGGY